MDHSELGATFMCMSCYGLLLVKTNADSLCHMFSADHGITSGLICSDWKHRISLVKIA